METRQKKYLNIILGLFITIVMICNSGYVLMMMEDAKPFFLLAPATAIIMILWIKNVKDNFVISYYSLSFIILSFFCIITLIANLELGSIMLYINILCLILFAFCISWFIEFKTFVSIYIRVMKYITLISLVFYALTNYFGVILKFPVISTPIAKYYNGVLFFQYTYSPARNSGIFWEPGLFASFIMIALVFQICFSKNKYKVFNILVFILGLLSTSSTAGYLMLPFVIVLIFADKVHTKSQFLLINLLILLGIVINIYSDDIIMFLIALNPEMFKKLETISSSTRLNGPLLNMKIFLSRPVFGVGFSNATKYFLQQNYLYKIDSQTSTSTFFLAAMGLPGIMYTYDWFHGIFGLKYKGIITRITIFIIFLFILNKEPHNGLVITYCIMFYFLKEADQSHRKLVDRSP